MPSSARSREPRHLRSFPTRRSSDLIPTIVIVSLTRELGPVLAGLMVAGRVGAAMAAELGTMRVTEQIDALTTLATDPLRYLVFPRLDRKSTRLNSSHQIISYAVFCSIPRAPTPTLFPYTTLFRSHPDHRHRLADPGARARARGPDGRRPRGRRDGGRARHDAGDRADRRADDARHRPAPLPRLPAPRSEEHTSELQSPDHLVCRLLLDPASPDTYALSLHDALPISSRPSSSSR